MDVGKTVKQVTALVAIIAALAPGMIPQEGAILAVLGVVVGYYISEGDHMRVLVTTIALGMMAGGAGGIPALGAYVTSILTVFAGVYAAASCTIVVMNLVNRLKP